MIRSARRGVLALDSDRVATFGPMRIIGGEARGRRLDSPRGRGTRPTADRVREALYSIVCARIDLGGASVLDLFAGSGALGLEALSRGAGSLVAVDSSSGCVRVIEQNALRLGWSARCEAMRLPAAAALQRLAARRSRFRLVVADPPYDLDPQPLLCDLARQELLEAGGLVVLEHRRSRQLEQRCGGLVQRLNRGYGDTALSVFELESDTGGTIGDPAAAKEEVRS